VSTAPDVLDGVVLSAEGLAKRTTDVHELRYAPTISIVQRLLDRRDGLNVPALLGGVVGGGGGDDDDDDDSGDDDDDVDDDDWAFDQVVEDEEEVPEWPLRDVSFRLAPGEALGIVGDQSAVSAVVQILARMTTPTAGRVVYRGRMGVSSELAKLLARRELAQPRQAMTTLATLAGVPRGGRKTWARSGLALMAGDDVEFTPAVLRKMRDRIPVAASFDPDAMILLIDELPMRDRAFRERCLARLRTRLAEGAAAIVTCRDTSFIAEVCTRAIWLENAAVKAEGEVEPIVRDFVHQRAVARRGDRGGLAFNGDVAIFSAFATDADGRRTHDLKPGAGVAIAVQFETAEPGTSVSWVVRFEGPTPAVVEQKHGRSLDVPGSYLAKLVLPARDLGEGEYLVTVEAHVVAGGRRSVVQRALPRPLVATERDASHLPQLGAAELIAEWSLLDDALL
jgi:ABC-2 type transport system ATP-binding protein